jgi:hypothetical protein
MKQSGRHTAVVEVIVIANEHVPSENGVEFDWESAGVLEKILFGHDFLRHQIHRFGHLMFGLGNQLTVSCRNYLQGYKKCSR